MTGNVSIFALPSIVQGNLMQQQAFTSCLIRGVGANALLAKITASDSENKDYMCIFSDEDKSLANFFQLLVSQLRKWVIVLYGEEEQQILLAEIEGLNSNNPTTHDKLFVILNKISRITPVQLVIPHLPICPAETVQFIRKFYYKTAESAVHLLLADDTLVENESTHQATLVFDKHQEIIENNVPPFVVIDTKVNLHVESEQSLRDLSDYTNVNIAVLQQKAVRLAIKLNPLYVDTDAEALEKKIPAFVMHGDNEAILSAADLLLEFYQQDELKNAAKIAVIRIIKLKHIPPSQYQANISDALHYKTTTIFKQLSEDLQINFFTALTDIMIAAKDTEAGLNLVSEVLSLAPEELRFEFKARASSEQTVEELDDHHKLPVYLFNRWGYPPQVLAKQGDDLRNQYAKYHLTPADPGTLLDIIAQKVTETFSGGAPDVIDFALLKATRHFKGKQLLNLASDNTIVAVTNYMPVLQKKLSTKHKPANSVLAFIRRQVAEKFVDEDLEFIKMAYFRVLDHFDDILLLPIDPNKSATIEAYLHTEVPVLKKQFALIKYQTNFSVFSTLVNRPLNGYRYTQLLIAMMLKHKLYSSHAVDCWARVLVLTQGAFKQKVEKSRPLYDLVHKIHRIYPENASLIMSYAGVSIRFRNIVPDDFKLMQHALNGALQSGNGFIVCNLAMIAVRYCDIAFSDNIEQRYAMQRQIILTIMPFCLNNSLYRVNFLAVLCCAHPNEALLGLDYNNCSPLIAPSVLTNILEQVLRDKDAKKIESAVISLFMGTEASEQAVKDTIGSDFKKYALENLTGYEQVLLILFIQGYTAAAGDAMMYIMFAYLTKIGQRIDSETGADIGLKKALEFAIRGYDLKFDVAKAPLASLLNWNAIASLVVAVSYKKASQIPQALREKMIKSKTQRLPGRLYDALMNAHIASLTTKYQSRYASQGRPQLEALSETTRVSQQHLSYGSRALIAAVDRMLKLAAEGKIFNTIDLAVTLMSAIRILDFYTERSANSAKNKRKLVAKKDEFEKKAYELFCNANAIEMTNQMANNKAELDPAGEEIEAIKAYLVIGTELSLPMQAALAPYMLELTRLRHIYQRESLTDTLQVAIDNSNVIKRAISLVEGVYSGMQSAVTVDPHLSAVIKISLLEDGLHRLLHAYLPTLATHVIPKEHERQPLSIERMVLMTRYDGAWKLLTADLNEPDSCYLQTVDGKQLPLHVIKKAIPNAITTCDRPLRFFPRDPYYANSLHTATFEKGIITIMTESTRIVLFTNSEIATNVIRNPVLLALIEILNQDMTKLIKETYNDNMSATFSSDSVSIHTTGTKRNSDEWQLEKTDRVQLDIAFELIEKGIEQGDLLITDPSRLKAALDIIAKYNVPATPVAKHWEKVKEEIVQNQCTKASDKKQQGWLMLVNQYFTDEKPSSLDEKQRAIFANMNRLIQLGFLKEFGAIKVATTYLHLPQFNPQFSLLLYVEQQAFAQLSDQEAHAILQDNNLWKPQTDFGQEFFAVRAVENIIYYLAIERLRTIEGMPGNDQRVQHQLNMLYSKYIYVDTNAINIEDSDRIALSQRVKSQDKSPLRIADFEHTQKHILDLMKKDTYARYRSLKIVPNSLLDKEKSIVKIQKNRK